jgi:hypothetical protein
LVDEEINLSNQIPDDFFAEKAAQIPKFALDVDGASVAVRVHGNSLRFSPKEK